VIPLFHDQIASGGPVTITVPDMTRFLVSLDQAVDTVFAALRDAKPGETFVPRVPAATVMNIAKALIGDRSIATKITGIRPGEKVDEILVSEEECHRTIEVGAFYSILPILPELNQREDARTGRVLKKEFSSGDTVLDLTGTAALLKKHFLMPDQISSREGGEILA